MVTRNQLIDRWAVGYQPGCQHKPGLWPCYPIMPQFGLMGLGGARLQRAHIPQYGVAGMGMLTGRYTYGMGQLVTVDTSWFNDPNQAMIPNVPNWVTLAFGGFALFSMVFTTSRGVSAGRKKAAVTKRKMAAAKAAYASTT